VPDLPKGWIWTNLGEITSKILMALPKDKKKKIMGSRYTY
jgi:hypothetical protein